MAGVEGIALYMQVRQDIQVGGRISATQYQYTLQDADVAQLNKWSGIILNKLTSLPQLRDVDTAADAVSVARQAPRSRFAARARELAAVLSQADTLIGEPA